MGWFRVILELAALFLSCHLPLVELADTEKLLDKVLDVQCRAEEMRFSLPSDFKDSASFFGVLSYDGTIHGIKDDPACGFWVGKKLDGSTEVSAAYSGCYIRVEDEDHVMTVMVQYIVNGEVEHRKRDITCPIVQAMDAPSLAECTAIQRNDRMPCGNSSVTQEICDQLGCCFTPRDVGLPCYFGKMVNAYCTNGQFVVGLSKDVTVPSLNLDLVHISVDAKVCPEQQVLKSPSFVRFDLPFTCGRNKVTEDSIVYEIDLEANRSSAGQNIISRDSTMRLTVRCSHSKVGAVPLMVEVLAPSPLPAVSTSGPLAFELRIAKDVQYRSYYQDSEYPVIRTLRDAIHLEVRILNRKDPNLVLILNNCWATPSAEPGQSIIWNILVHSCPYEDAYLTQLSPVGSTENIPYPGHYQRFIVSTFVFVDQINYTPLTQLVYFHCSASVCTTSATQTCSRPCPPALRKRRIAQEPTEVMVTKGPVVLKGNVKEGNIAAKELAVNSLALELLNKTAEPDFIGAKEPIDDLTDGGFPRRVEGTHDPHSNMMMWLRGAAVGGGILAIIVTVFGVCRCHRNRQQIMHTVKA